MVTAYIIRGWTKDALDSHEFAYREASRRNDHNKANYYAQAEEFRFEFEENNDDGARKYADMKYPQLTERRELLKVITIAIKDECHSSHKTRISLDASTYDEICIICGSTDKVPGGWGDLRFPCKGKRK